MQSVAEQPPSAASAPVQTSNGARHILQIYVGALSAQYEALSVEASKATTAEEIVSCIVERLILPHGNNYELAEVAGECKERRLSPGEKPVSVMLLWPQHEQRDFHRFYLRETQTDAPWRDSYGIDPQVFRDFIPFLLQPDNREYPDLCQLPDLNESTLLENLRQRFEAGHIYTYVGSILIAVNPFKFHPIYNPKYVRLYQNQRIGPILPPHIFAIADNAYYSMLKEKRNQCVVISGESGSGKTESTNFLLHHLTALSQKGLHGSGVEQTILSAGPVLEAFGNAKTAHNNNSSRFGKFIQVNYRENGMVQGAVVQKYLLEKSRIVSQGPFERNYHVFYYLLSGATEQECEALHLLAADKYCYLNAKNLTLENCDEKYEFSRLKQSMEMVGFSPEKQRRLFTVLSAVLLLGNVEFFPKKSTYHHDESVQVRNPSVVALISELLKVKHDTLLAALTSKRVKASGETLVMQYRLPEAIAARDALAKCLYGALFDWIVLQVNHALLNKDQVLYTGHSIGVLDIFGFEDFGSQNSFEQLCINYANEHLQYYFNLHVFKYEQNEYKKESIKWRDIDFLDNSGCLQLFESKPTGLLCILDDLCNFPGATNETLLQKFNSVHKDSKFYEKPQKKENAFIIKHYAGKVKYQVAEMREKNLDLMRQDIVSVLKNSSMAFVRELVGADPVAVFRWAIIRAFFRGYFAFRQAGAKHRKERNDLSASKLPGKNRFRMQNDMILSQKSDPTGYESSSSSPSHRHSSGGSSSSSNNNSTSAGSSVALFAQGQHHHVANATSAATNAANHPLKQRKWSTIAFNNKNFPDGKLGYGSGGGAGLATSGGSTGLAGSYGGAGGSSGGSGGGSQSSGSKLFSKGYSKFEQSGQEAMARASQIVQKNKSFRPGTRPKKGLKNLQTVKTLTAGQNLCNPSTVKTRKQPLTVTAQFQNSLSALMDTLNQANPFFIRCIKSNADKIPNKFDEATVIRQLRYTGMLETVRIRRAGYNVRLTYEEFIQLYRILLPKGLVSSQKDVRDFMNTMNLNKQHYQLGVTKIYMRESEKIRLDLRLHTRIIESIVSIQRWFRSLLERRKFIAIRAAAISIQANWRTYRAQRDSALGQLRRRQRAAVVIQAQWRMYVRRRWFVRTRNAAVVVQAHIRGKLARISARERLARALKSPKDRYPLRPTQSLPANDRSLDVIYDPDDMKSHLNAGGVPHHSVDSALDNNVTAGRDNILSQLRSGGYSVSSSSGLGSATSSISGGSRHLESLANNNNSSVEYQQQQQQHYQQMHQQQQQHPQQQQQLHKRDVLHKAENQFRSLMISASPTSPQSAGQPPQSHKALTAATSPAQTQFTHHFSNTRDVTATVNAIWMQHHAQQHQPQSQPQQQQQHDYQNMRYGKEPRGGRNHDETMTDSYSARSSSGYDVERVSRRGYVDESGDQPVKRLSIKPLSRRSESVDPQRHCTSATSASLSPSSSASDHPHHLPTIMYPNKSLDLSHAVPPPPPQQTSTPIAQPLPPIERAIARITHNQSGGGSGGVGRELAGGYYRLTAANSPSSVSSSSLSSSSATMTMSPINSSGQSHSHGHGHTSHSSPTQQQQSQNLQQLLQQQQQQHQHLHYSDPGATTAVYTPSKAAALLGTIAENQIHPRHHHHHLLHNNQSAAAAQPQPRRIIKHNASADSVVVGNSHGDGCAPAPAPIGYKHHHPAAAAPPTTVALQRHGDSLRRRNSDPTSKVTLLEVNRGNDMYQSSTHINIAGHRFHKATRISKAEKCASCMESDAFVNEGHRCMDCKVLVHTKCIQNGGVKTLQCEAKRSKRLRKNVDKSIGSMTQTSLGGGGGLSGSARNSTALTSTPNSKYSGTREYTDSTDKIISDAKELQLMQDFITQKICKMDSDCGKPSEVDRVFKQSLREFKKNLVAQYSVAHKQNADTLNIKYRDLIANFEQVMETCCERRDDFPLTMGVNAFRGFLNEFMGSRETEKPKAKRKKEKKRKVEEHTSFNGHTFQLLLINIPTACEICQLFLMWPIERGLVCQNCRLTCHKKCYQKSYACNKSAHGSGNSGSGSGGPFGPHHLSYTNSTLFGVPLTALCATADGSVKIPAKIDQLITKIEMHGLYTEGLYRKSGVNSKIKELKSKMSDVPAPGATPAEQQQQSQLDYESYNVHVLANVLKSFLREMPEPLLSFDRYDDFLRASELSETADRVSTLLSLIKKLPPAHHALLERLVFHLALVAQCEKDNRMSASSLAIVFAPCVLRTNRQIPAQDSLNDIGRQTKCMETLITQKMLNVKSTLADIDTLDTAAHEASSRLTTIRRSKVFTQEEFAQRPQNAESETEEMLLEDHIQEIKKEKAMLTSTLPSLARANSDDDLLSTDLDGEGGSLDDLSSSKDGSNGPLMGGRGDRSGGGGGDHGQQQQQHLKDSIGSGLGSDNVSRRTVDSDSTSTTSTCLVAGGVTGLASSRENFFVDADGSGGSGGLGEPVAVSYNLREQNIDYIQAQAPTTRGKSCNVSALRWSGSQQNLHFATSATSTAAPVSSSSQSVSSQPGGSELQRQKPLAVRSMSGGYEQTVTATVVTTSGSMNLDMGRQTQQQQRPVAPAKRQNSLDDEPIMV